MRARIGRVGELLSHDVQGDGDDRHNADGDPEQMRITLHVRGVHGDHAAERGVGRAEAEAQVAQEDLVGDKS